MADNYLEKHREEYEKKKAAWLLKKKHIPRGKSKSIIKSNTIQPPEDETL